jgi:hypothetical protein
MKRMPIQKTRYKNDNDPAARFVREAEIVYDSRGRKKKVILPYKAYKEAIAYIEDIDDLKAMKEAETDEPSIPLEELKKRILKKLS